MKDVKQLPVVILAGGFGTRLREVVADRPKPMALVNEKPFLEYLLKLLTKSGAVSQIILSVGYLHEQIMSHFGVSFNGVPITYSIEETPLGTGGAVAKAAALITEEDFFLANGDTLFEIEIDHLLDVHNRKVADVTIALKKMTNFDRYGTVVCSNDNVTGFKEKCAVSDGLINGGVYIIRKEALLKKDLPRVFSLEKDFLQAYSGVLNMAGVVFDSYFIDIGIPEDFERAQNELLKLIM